MKIYIVRHGETALNAKKVMQGRLDEPLNKNGRDLAILTGQAIKGMHFDHCISSPLDRAMETAKLILRESGNDIPIITDERLLEMDYGPYEGADLTSPPPEILKFFGDFVNQPEPPGMEPLADIVDRLGTFLEELREDPPEGSILISTHAIAMKGALEYLTPGSNGSYWGKHIKNCDIYVTTLKDGEFTVPELLETGE